jgi:hypothetical protein
MTEEQISQWARESNMLTPLYDYQKEQLQAFANIVRRHTLEEAAKVTESFSEECSFGLTHADAIRSMKV